MDYTDTFQIKKTRRGYRCVGYGNSNGNGNGNRVENFPMMKRMSSDAKECHGMIAEKMRKIEKKKKS